MGSSTVTETKLLEKQSLKSDLTNSYSEIKQRNGKSSQLFNNDRTIMHENQDDITPYEIMRSRKDFAFMAKVREWEKSVGFVTPLRWTNIFLITSLHTITVLWFLNSIWMLRVPKWQSFVFFLFTVICAGVGVTGGVHRYWCHRSYKANLPLQLLLLFGYTVAGQNTVFEWVRDHRVHHKYSETTADPHDANRGLFFSHVGWLMMKKHPDVIRKGNKIDMSDITGDPLLQFHTKYFMFFKLLISFILPTVLPVYLWNETWGMAFFMQPLFRYTSSLNATWSVNSFAHTFGNKPYDKNIMPAENKYVSLFAWGEGWHNYHHTFPWDYKAGELGIGNYSLNWTTYLLDGFAKIGWAYDLKKASPALIKAVAEKRGERSG